MAKITLITGHYFGSKRRAGFHHLAKAFQELGHEVLFFTAPVSKLHQLKGDHIMQYAIKEEANQMITKEAVHSYVHFTPWHVANTRFSLTNALTSPLVPYYATFDINKEAIAFIKNSSYIVFESTPGLLLFDKIKKLNPKAKFIYRVSDDLRFLQVHPALIKYEEKILPFFDLVSIVSSHFFTLFSQKNVKLHFHGIDKQTYDQAHLNPYPLGSKNLVFIGNAYFDVNFLEVASSLFPEFNFHIIGPIQNLPIKPNIKAYGEMPFQETIGYIKYADAGLHTLQQTNGAEAFTDTLKVHQYTYCQLPIVAPSFLKTSRKHAFYYTPGNAASIQASLEKALRYPHCEVDNRNVLDWKELAQKLIIE
ncbi:hypothetical protein OO017_16445 [Pontibacter sp. M82]|uniref:Glucuronosyltransferase GumK N-terminal domain-containing protein n=1 Tax=Pontibacter anaerobius TaxID=2993940 RepID=A0ABT3RI96_9BACT|nr:hypothetical protein [Pontibacter anaerobius]MCX2741551.1 hypothetical protein [Pontibacter anaerobius]